MNHIHLSLWNARSGTFVAVAENASRAGQKTASRCTGGGGNAHFVPQALALALMLAFGGGVFALPLGGVVVGGAAHLAQGVGTSTIVQSTPQASIQWQSFNIAPGESVRFVQPNAQSVVLNRVLGADPSRILGSLQANGHVFLVNPNGILFGQGAQVNVGGLVASTLLMSEADALAGTLRWSGESGASVVNRGIIQAQGGHVALLGAQVSNEGVIVARLGTVVLAAGQAVTLDVAGDGLLHVMVDRGAVNALAHNGGLIQADGGQVMLTAHSAGGLLHSAVNNTGVVQAQSVANHNGRIRLLGGGVGSQVHVSGTLDVSGPGEGMTGGAVQLLGETVHLTGATILASGDAGGGRCWSGATFRVRGQNRVPRPPRWTPVSASVPTPFARGAGDRLWCGPTGVPLWLARFPRAGGPCQATVA